MGRGCLRGNLPECQKKCSLALSQPQADAISARANICRKGLSPCGIFVSGDMKIYCLYLAGRSVVN